MTKFLVVLVLAFVGTLANAQSNAKTDVKSAPVVFECNSEIQIDATLTEKIGMTIELHGSDLLAYYVGASQPGPLPASKEVLSFKDSLKVGGITHILAKLSPPMDQSKIASATIYTEGNFDDDAAGVRGVEFVDAQGAVLGKGMFFGWGGPVACL